MTSYILEMSIDIDSHRPYGPKVENALKKMGEQIIDCLLPLGFENRIRGISLYHPDEECEVRGIDFAAWSLQPCVVAAEFRQVPFLVQAVQAIAGLFDNPEGFSVSCRLLSLKPR